MLRHSKPTVILVINYAFSEPERARGLASRLPCLLESRDLGKNSPDFLRTT